MRTSLRSRWPERFISPGKWGLRFMRQARDVASWSKDPSTKVGAVAVLNHTPDDRDPVAVGYNGLPRGFDDSPEALADRDYRLRHTIHAERNCVYRAARRGVSLLDTDLYVYGLPMCEECAKAAIPTGFRRVFMCVPVERPDWQESFEATAVTLDTGNIPFYFVDNAELDG